MTSVSVDLQKGQRISLPPFGGGSGLGVPLSTRRHVPLFRQPLQHLERRWVDPSRCRAATYRIPCFPVDGQLRRFAADALFEHASQLANAVSELALGVELIDIRLLRTDPFERFAPHPFDGGVRFRLLHPAA